MRKVLLSRCLAVMWLLSVSQVLVYGFSPGGLQYRSINVDGDPGDWGGVPPLVVDGEGDAGVVYSEEDIKAVYGVNDDENLYFLMELWPDVEPYYLNGGVWESVYRFYIDILPGGDPLNNSADFYVEFWESGSVQISINGYSVDVDLHYWDGSGWYTACECEEVQGERSELFIEVSVPWDCIGGSDCFNCFFYAHHEEDVRPSASDYAPDKEDPVVVIGCCPWEPPVGGELIPSRTLRALYVSSLAALILVGIAGIQPRTRFQGNI
jgi:hypothetical protein